jgi:protein-tyrosine phosphatase
MVDLELYGGRRGYVFHLAARTMGALGAYRRLGALDWGTVTRLVFVCKGNICRSPYAAARAQQLAVEATSFGLDAIDGAPANSDAARCALARQVDLSAHRSSRLEQSRIREGDLLIVFEPSQLSAIHQRCGAGPLTTSLMGIWAQPSRPYIRDPYGASDRYFQQCFALIDANVHQLATRLLQARATR